MTPVAILKKYFGLLPGQSIQEFSQEIKALSANEKSELAALAAVELGVEVENK